MVSTMVSTRNGDLCEPVLFTDVLVERAGTCECMQVGRLCIFLASLRIWPAGMMLLLLKITSSGNAESRTPHNQEIQ